MSTSNTIHLPNICRSAVEAERKNELSFLIEILKNFLLDTKNQHIATEHKNIEQLLFNAKRAVSDRKISREIGADGLALYIDNSRLHILHYLNELKKSCPSVSYFGTDLMTAADRNKRNPKLYEWEEDESFSGGDEDNGGEGEEFKFSLGGGGGGGGGSFPQAPGGPMSEFEHGESPSPFGPTFSGSLGGGRMGNGNAGNNGRDGDWPEQGLDLSSLVTPGMLGRLE